MVTIHRSRATLSDRGDIIYSPFFPSTVHHDLEQSADGPLLPLGLSPQNCNYKKEGKGERKTDRISSGRQVEEKETEEKGERKRLFVPHPLLLMEPLSQPLRSRATAGILCFFFFFFFLTLFADQLRASSPQSRA